MHHHVLVNMPSVVYGSAAQNSPVAFAAMDSSDWNVDSEAEITDYYYSSGVEGSHRATSAGTTADIHDYTEENDVERGVTSQYRTGNEGDFLHYSSMPPPAPGTVAVTTVTPGFQVRPNIG